VNDAERFAQQQCAKEPIHALGRIQSHGCLLALDPADLCVLQLSHNSEQFLGRSPTQCLGKHIDSLLVQSASADLEGPWHAQASGTRLLLSAADANKRLLGRYHRNSQNLWLWEIEPLSDLTDAQGIWIRQSASLQKSIQLLQRANGLQDLLQILCTEVQRLTELDRVMIYRFDPQWHGEVAAEALVRGDSYLGQRFPASDIPAQARAVFLKSWIRSIADVEQPAVFLVPVQHPRSGEALDMGLCQLRHSSLMHLEYLRNMGVAATLTLSLVHNGALWGLVACHHLRPKTLSPFQFEACQILAQLASSLLGTKQAEQQAAYSASLQAVHAKLVAAMHASDPMSLSLTRYTPTLLDLVGAQGAAAALDPAGRWTVIGNIPSLNQLLALADWLQRTHGNKEVFSTDKLSDLYPPAEAFKDCASGLLAVRIPKAQSSFVLWFRPEVRKTVTWAGDPTKQVQKTQTGQYIIHPRISFALWKQITSGCSEPWQPCEIEAAQRLRKSMIEIDFERQFKRERQSRAEAEIERRNYAFLSDASIALSTSLQQSQVIETLGQLSLQTSAEWAVVRLKSKDSTWAAPQVFHGTPAGMQVLQEIYSRAIAPQAGGHNSSQLLDGQDTFEPCAKPELLFPQLAMPHAPQGVGLSAAENTAQSQALQQFSATMGLRSYLAVALRDRAGNVSGCLEWGISDVPRSFSHKDLELARQLALRGSTAYEHLVLYQAAQKAAQAREEMVAVVSHDLKNPLTAISLNAQMVLRALSKGAFDLAHSPTIKIIETERRMRRLIDDLLNLTTMEANQLRLNVKKISLNSLLRESAEQLQPLAVKKGSMIHVDADPIDRFIMGEWDRLLQVLSNVGGNAIKFSPPASTITLQVRVSAGEAIVSVSDKGPGIPPENLQKIFTRFWQAKETARQGSGIGLAIAKGFVEAHQGRIWAESSVGSGTTLRMAFPLVRET
jgi:light-regulated signal transduction histidine kinase (bacteriophytochrome)